MIRIDRLQVRYGQQLALDLDEPIRIDEGERIGIIGSNGAGKTTLLNALLGLVPSRGEYKLAILVHEIAVHLQQNKYAGTMAVRHIIETITGVNIGRDERLDELIEFFSFGSSLGKRFNQLSGGQQQRLTLIMVLRQDAPLVFFDEVTSGLDFESRQALVELWLNGTAGAGRRFCYITHYYEELETLASKILYLDEGRLVCYGDKEALFQQYCGRSVYVLSRTEANEALTSSFRQIHAPQHQIALSSPDVETDMAIAWRLNEANVNYKRSTSDVEIMSTNAKAMSLAARRSA